MPSTITITLPEDIQIALDEAVREAGKSSDEILYEALRNYLFIHKFRLLRKHMTSKAKTQGVCTDQDVFDRIS